MDATDALAALPNSAEALGRSDSLQAVLRWHEQGQKRLSIGLELECYLPDLGALIDRLLPVEDVQELYALVAQELSKRVLQDEHRCRSSPAVSADSCDWGRLWTATADGSIQPEGRNPFPVELVSKRMSFDDLDVTLFCDMTSALRLAPLRAVTNESTGLHVHIGRYPGFFSVEEVAAILKVYLRFESAINTLLLPVTRQRNRFCRDLREVLARAQGVQGIQGHEDRLLATIDAAVKSIRNMSPKVRSACVDGCVTSVSKGDLMTALLGEGGLWRLKTPIETLDLEADGRPMLLPAGLTLKEMSCNGQRLWSPPTALELQALWGKDGGGDAALADPPTPWTVMEQFSEKDYLQCLFQKPDEVSAASLDHWLLRDSLILERHGMRYCKLNIMRICQPSDRATLEFRQFPGGDFNQPLLIWGWVKFLGLLVTHACACADGVSPFPVEGSEEELKRFLRLRSDSLLLAWFRDVRNRLPKPEVAVLNMKQRWEKHWEQWAREAQEIRSQFQAPFSKLLSACKSWRRIFQAASGMKAMFPSTDPVWSPLTQRRVACDSFMQELYKTISLRLKHHIQLLIAAEEISRRCSLETVVSMLSDGRLRRSNLEIRELQAAAAETMGWDMCPEELRIAVGELGRKGAELTLDYARNLLEHCERPARAAPRAALADALDAATAEPPAPVRSEGLLLWRTYHELCPLADVQHR